MTTQQQLDRMNLEQTGEPTFLQRHWQKIAALIFWVIILGAGFAYARVYNLSLADLLRQIVELMQTPYGPLLYVLIYAIRPLTFLSAAALTLAAGSIFGAGGPLNLALAVGYTVVASHVSASVAYLIGRYFGGSVIEEDGDEEEAGVIQRWAGRIRRNTFETVLTMRVLFLPFDLVSYLAGFLRVSWFKFITGSILGSVAGTIAFVSFGASLSIDQILSGTRPDFNPWVFVLGLLLMAVSIGISRYFKRREAAREAGV